MFRYLHIMGPRTNNSLSKNTYCHPESSNKSPETTTNFAHVRPNFVEQITIYLCVKDVACKINGFRTQLGTEVPIRPWSPELKYAPYVERFMHQFWGNILVPQCVIFEGTVRTGPPPKQVKTCLAHNSGWS
jgi:hypothetical protein